MGTGQAEADDTEAREEFIERELIGLLAGSVSKPIHDLHEQLLPRLRDLKWRETRAVLRRSPAFRPVGRGEYGLAVEQGDEAATVDSQTSESNRMPAPRAAELEQVLTQSLESGPLSAEDIARNIGGDLNATRQEIQRVLERSSRFAVTDGGVYRLIERRSLRPSASPVAHLPRHSLTPTPAPAGLAEQGELERELCQRLRGRRLVAEIGLNRAQYEHVCAAAQEVLRWHLADVEQMVSRFPALFATHLVAHGVFTYDHGDYWSSVRGEGFANECGPLFVNVLRKLGLDFETDPGGHAYVGRILLHAAIPEYCADDYTTLLSAGLRNHGDSGEELLWQWSQMRSAYTHVDIPVKRFLTKGGPFAVDLVNRSIDVITDRPDHYSDVYGLPPYLFQALLRAETPERTGVRDRVGAPQVILDPFSFDGPSIEFPAVDGQLLDARWSLPIAAGSVTVPSSRVAVRERLPRATAWSVSLVDAGVAALTKTFPGLPAEPAEPILLFSEETERLLSSHGWLDADGVLVVHPIDAEIHNRVIEAYGEFGGEWSGFRTSLVDLGGADALRVGTAVRRVNPVRRPVLAESPVAGASAVDGRPVYRSLPSIDLPDGDPNDWQVRVRRNGAVTEWNAGDLLGAAEGRLGLPAGSTSIEEVELRVRGPLGSDLNEAFWVVNGLTITKPDRVALPTMPPVTLVADAGAGVLLAGQRAWSHQVAPGANGTTDLNATDEGGTSVSLRVETPALNWRWEIGTASQRHEQDQAEATLSIPDLLDGTLRGLRGSLGVSDIPLSLSVEGAGRALQHSPKIRSSRHGGRFSFNLGMFADTLRASTASGLDLLLHVGATPVRLARLRPRFEIDNLTVHTTVVADAVTVHLSFEQDRPIASREVRFWPLNRPWSPPVCRPLENSDVSGTVTLGFAYDEVPPGRYRIELALHDWAVVRRPAEGAPNTADVWIGDRDQVHARLGHDSSDGLRPPDVIFEHFLQTGTLHERVEPTDVASLVPHGVASLYELLVRPDLDRHLEAIRQLRGLLTHAPDELLTELAASIDGEARSPGERAAVQAVLAGGIGSVRQPAMEPAAFDALWRAFPALALERCLAGPPGSLLHDQILNRTNLPDDFVAGQTEVPDLAPVEQIWLALPTSQLRSLAAECGLRGSPPLFTDHDRQLTHFEWIAAAAATTTLQDWWTRHQTVLRRHHAVPEISRYVKARRAKGAAAHANIPVLSLTCAGAAVSVGGSGAMWARHVLIELSRSAPRLVEFDLTLCLASRAHAPRS